MKRVTKFKIFFLLIVFVNLKNAQAQQYDAANNKILNDIEAFIITTAKTDSNEFQNLINYGEGLIAKDTNVLLYNAYPTKTLHADGYSVFNYFNDSIFLYNCLYENKNNVLLVIKAIDRILKYSKGDWKIVTQKSIEDNDSVPYLFYKKRKILFFQRALDNTSLRIAFISYETDNRFGLYNTNNNDDSFLNSVNKNLDDIDKTILKTDAEKVKEIQTTLINIIVEGKKWFAKNIGDISKKDATAIYYKAVATNKMYAKEFKGQKLLSDGFLYYVCTYTNANDVANAVKAINDLPSLKNSKWMIVKFIDNNSYSIQKLYLDGVYVGYTSRLKIINQFDIFIKRED